MLFKLFMFITDMIYNPHGVHPGHFAVDYCAAKTVPTIEWGNRLDYFQSLTIYSASKANGNGHLKAFSCCSVKSLVSRQALLILDKTFCLLFYHFS